MSGNSIGTVLGGAIGFMVSGPAGISMGMSIGGFVGQILMPDELGLKDQYGQRLRDLKITSATYGAHIHRIYGSYRVGGNIIWANPIKETMHQREEEVGKGRSESYTVTWYTYSVDMAVALCEGPISGIRKIWANSVKIYDISEGGKTSNYRSSEQISGSLTFHLGESTQKVDWFLKSIKPNTPAYRNIAYIVFDDFQLENYGNSIPNITAEVVKNGSHNFTKDCSFLLIRGNLTWYCDDYANASPNPPNFYELIKPVSGYILNSIKNTVYTIHQGDGGCDYWGDGRCLITTVYDRGNIDSNGKNLLNNMYRYYCNTTGQTYRSNILSFYTDEEDTLIVRTWGGTVKQIEWYKPTKEKTDFSEYGYFKGKEYFYDDYTPVYLYDGFLYMQDSFDSNPITEISYGPKLGTGEKSYNTFIFDNDIYGLYIRDNSLFTFKIFVNYVIIQEYNVPKFDLLSEYTINVTVNKDKHLLSVDLYSKKFYALHNATLVYGDLNTLEFKVINSSVINMHYSSSVFYADGSLLYYLSTDGKMCTFIPNTLSSNKVTLSSICAELLEAVGVHEYDVTSLDSIMVTGFYISNISSPRASLDTLRSTYMFDLIEQDFKIVAKLRGSYSLINISKDDLIDNYEVTKRLNTELPKKVTLKYANDAIDYQVSSQSSQMSINVENIATIELPLAISDDEAKKLSDLYLYTIWDEKNTYHLKLPIGYINDINLGDVLSISLGNFNNKIKITKMIISNVIEIEGVNLSEYSYDSTGSDTGLGFESKLKDLPCGSDALFLDIPTIDNSMLNKKVIYYGAESYCDYFSNSLTFSSVNEDISTFTKSDFLTNQLITGKSVEKLNSGPHTFFDLQNTVKVQTDYNLLQFNITLEELLSGKNYCLLGNEILQFMGVSYDGQSYTLSTLLRGRRGTEAYIDNHSEIEKFVYLNNSISTLPVDLNQTIYARIVPNGTFLTDSSTKSKLYTGNNLKPFSVGSTEIITTNDYDDYIYWQRRDRYISGYFRKLPLSEDTEEYTVNVYDNSDNLVDVRILPSPTINYTTQDKINNGLILGNGVKYEIFQNPNGHKIKISPKTVESYLSYILEIGYRVYRLDGNTLTFYDLKNNYPMSLENGVLFNEQGGLSNSQNTCIRTNSTITQAGTDLVNDRVVPTSRFSLSLLFKISGTENNCTIAHLGYEKGSTADVVAFKAVKSGMNLYVGHSVFGANKYAKAIDLNDYVNIDWVWIFVDNSYNDYKVYINGELHDSIVRTTNANHSFHLGGTTVGGTKRYDVTIDEVVLYNNWDFQASEIKYIYNLMQKELQ